MLQDHFHPLTSSAEPQKASHQYKMAQLRTTPILVLIIAAAVLLQNIEAKDYTVGDATGWTSFPPAGASFYSKWAANIAFKVNDTLVFNFESGSHTVAELTKHNYDKCNVNNNTKVFSTGPARITLNHTGDFYFSCTFSGHCSSGQKLSIKVTGSSAPTPAKAPAEGPSASPPESESVPTSPSNEGATLSPSSSPSEPGAIAPPPHVSAATHLVATFSVFLITISINFLSLF
ncbi:hypothetical protein RJT34_32519 [Clitoria ternatea]|uniref:Phytocyanin domain-containing protein n=1 Tax=Clitoria ternatea TaxID=43366 RepID=A0AAN9EX53_CLITE